MQAVYYKNIILSQFKGRFFQKYKFVDLATRFTDKKKRF